MAYLHQAIEKDPADPLAYAGLAGGYNIIGHGPAPSPDALPRAKAAALKALELDETLAEAHAALAEVKLYYDWDWAGAEQAFQRALELNPNLAEAHGHYAWYLVLLGRLDEALAETKRARELDPLAPIYSAWLGQQYGFAGQYDEAIDEVRKSLELNPDFPMGLYALGSIYAAKGMYEEAIAVHQKAGAVDPDLGWLLGHTYALAGRRDEALNVLAELGEEYRQRNAWGVAEIYAALGEKDEGASYLILEYVPGETLAGRPALRRPAAPPELAGVDGSGPQCPDFEHGRSAIRLVTGRQAGDGVATCNQGGLARSVSD